VLALLALGALLAGVVTLIRSAPGGYRVNAVFDNAGFLIPGEDVKIAGAKVGTVTGLSLAPQHKALVQMRVGGDFAPFHTDADCTIEPESLIGEEFVQCTPGTPRAPALPSLPGRTPTLPLAKTHSPIDLDLVLSTFDQPTRMRLALFVNELGAGIAGRAGDLNAAIRRANPALQATEQALAVVNADRAHVQSLISASDRVVGALAQRRQRVGAFIDSASAVTATAASHRDALAATVSRLPSLLAQAQPALARLDAVARTATPVAHSLTDAAPALTTLAAELPGFAASARPALRRLGTAAAVGAPAFATAAPIVSRLRTFAASARPTGKLVNELFQSIRARGAVEGLLSFTYWATAALSRYDATSHFLPIQLLGSPCIVFATAPAAGCNAHFASFDSAAAARAAQASRTRRRHRSHHAHGRPTPSPASGTPPPVARTPSAPANPVSGLSAQLQQLLAPLQPSAPPPPQPPPDSSLRRLLNYLLK
jgi:virulence factor Mce-like protein